MYEVLRACQNPWPIARYPTTDTQTLHAANWPPHVLNTEIRPPHSGQVHGRCCVWPKGEILEWIISQNGRSIIYSHFDVLKFITDHAETKVKLIRRERNSWTNQKCNEFDSSMDVIVFEPIRMPWITLDWGSFVVMYYVAN